MLGSLVNVFDATPILSLLPQCANEVEGGEERLYVCMALEPLQTG